MASTKRTCETCGGHVQAAGRRGGRPAKYCSGACRQRAFRQRAAAAGREELAGTGGPEPPPGGALPRALDRFVGRARELADLRGLLRSARLLTLVGPGGAGKSRLALELLAGRRGHARIVELDPLRDGALLPQYVAAALGVAERGGPVQESLVRALGRLVLVLDNCEHLADSCAESAALLLRRCPDLRIVATSREALRVPGEVVYRVGPLTAGGDAVRLFAERARTCDSGFELTPESEAYVTEICRRLDGLPLAIELAARRVAGLPLGQILAGLDDQLGLLTGGSRVGPVHHRELRAAIEWSHRLLDPAEQAVFRRVSALVGGFGLEGARAVCDEGPVLPLLCSLEAKSLLVRVAGDGQNARFRQLSSIRAYGLARLAASGDLPAVRERALDWLTGLCPDSAAVVPRELIAEQENLAEGVACAAASGGDRYLRLAVAMARVRREQDQLTACRALLTAALARVPESDHRSDALALAARVACMQRDAGEGLRLAEEAVAAARRLERPAALADALDSLAVALVCREDYGAAVAVYRECLQIARTLGRPLATAVCLHRLAWALHHVPEDGAVAEARALLAECLPVLRDLATPQHRAAAVHTAGALHLAAGDAEAAEEAFVEVLREAPPETFHAMYPVEGLAIVAAERGEPRRALRLAAGAARVRERIGVRPEVEWQRRVDTAVEGARRRLGAAAADAATGEGRLLGGEKLVAYALGEGAAGVGRPARGTDSPLTERELQVAVLVAEGLTNGQVAARLGLSPRTVASHLDHIRDKLGLRSRTKIALWVAERG